MSELRALPTGQEREVNGQRNIRVCRGELVTKHDLHMLLTLVTWLNIVHLLSCSEY